MFYFEQLLAVDNHTAGLRLSTSNIDNGRGSQPEREREWERAESQRVWERETHTHTHTEVGETERADRKKDSEDRDSPNWIHASNRPPFKDTLQPTSLLSRLISPRPVLVLYHSSLRATEQNVHSLAGHASHYLPPLVFHNLTLKNISWHHDTLAILFPLPRLSRAF